MINIRNPKESEFEKIYNFVSRCKPLESYGDHFYRIMLRYFNNTCLIAEEENNILGFILGVISQTDPKSYFLWQIGVNPEVQGQGIGRKMLEHIEIELKRKNINRIELTIDPENKASQKLFEKNGYSIISKPQEETFVVQDRTALRDYYGKDRHFFMYEKII